MQIYPNAKCHPGQPCFPSVPSSGAQPCFQIHDRIDVGYLLSKSDWFEQHYRLLDQFFSIDEGIFPLRTKGAMSTASPLTEPPDTTAGPFGNSS